MLQVCDAVAYAHRQLIVHRDIKPGNILVDANGQATLRDFGIARLLDAEDSGEQTVTRAFTPDYAAPEQRRGEGALGTAVDVYGLGAVLYRLLVGASPAHDAKGDVVPAARAARARGDTHAAAIMRGDLDAILAQALANEPARRYASVDALANDLQAWLHHRPLRARRATAWTRLRKFVRRNRAASVLALVAILAAGAGLTSFILGNRALERRAAQLQAVTKFQTDMLMQFAPDRAGATLRKAVADARGKTVPDANTAAAALNRIDYTGLSIDMLDAAILAPSIDAAHQHFSDQPRVEGMLLLALTEAYLGLGRLDKARALQERVTALARKHFGAGDRLTLMSLRDEMKLVRQAESPDAEAISRDIVRQHERYLGVNDIDTAIARGLLGEWLVQHGKTAEAESILRDSGTRIARERGQDDPDAVSARANLAFAISSQGRYAESVPLYRSAAETMTKEFGADHPYTLTSLNNLAYALNHSGRGDEALPIYRRVFEARRRVLGAKHQATLISENNLAVDLGRQGKNAEAEPLQREVYAGFRDTRGAHDATTLHAGLNLARNELALRHHTDVDVLVAQLLEGWRQPRDAKPIAQAQRILAQSLQGQGRRDAAEAAFEQSWQAALAANDTGEQRETAQAALALDDKDDTARHDLWQQRLQTIIGHAEKPSAAPAR
jgi:serine/threonine-protein kinase